VSDESLGSAESHFSTEPGGEPAGPGRFVNVDSIKPVEFLPGLGFRPVLGYNAMTNFVSFEPNTEAPKHVHEEEQIVIVLDGEFTFDIDGETRVMRKGDVAVVPAWVPHGAWTTDSTCLEVDVFAPPRQSLLKLAAAQSADSGGEAEQLLAEGAAEEEGLVAEAEAEEAAAEKASGA
jgi:quercetin dioxygenase-like cupin family protein